MTEVKETFLNVSSIFFQMEAQLKKLNAAETETKMENEKLAKVC